jgi:uncharacterized protein YcfJ
MKQVIASLLLVSAFALMPVPTTIAAAVVPVNTVDYSMNWLDYGACPRGTFRVRKHTRTKKKVRNSIIAGAAGAAVGGLAGGGKGALIGAGVGAGGYLTYRYVKDRHGRCVRRYA